MLDHLQLASDIIGDLRGILSDIRDEENVLQDEQTLLVRVIEGALEHSDIGERSLILFPISKNAYCFSRSS